MGACYTWGCGGSGRLGHGGRPTNTARIDEYRERDALIRQNPDTGVIPDAVANRMILRMATLGGVPVFGGMALFVFFFFQAKAADNVFQPGLVAYATTAPFVLGLLGLSCVPLCVSLRARSAVSAPLSLSLDVGVSVMKR